MIFSEEPSGRNDPYTRQRETFPRLAPEMMARAIVYGSEESIVKGSGLFHGGAALHGATSRLGGRRKRGGPGRCLSCYLRSVQWTDRATGRSEPHPIGSVFVMTDAEPNTEWLGGCLDLDGKGFIRTGTDASGEKQNSAYVTALPDVFAVGDVRSGSVKRVASAVGEGSVVVAAVHEYIAFCGPDSVWTRYEDRNGFLAEHTMSPR
jgi:hypothetical protein